MAELKNLEEFIIDNYIDLDKDIPEELKDKYKILKNQYLKSNVNTISNRDN